MEIRDLRDDEIEFLRDMLYEAIFWSPERERLPREFVLAHEQGARYHEGWGRPGDVALVAEEDGERLGCCWYRLFTEEDHGAGYVDPQTPELAIGVVDAARGRGVGRALMEAMHERARREGIARMALSVDVGNPAKRLYASLGYVDYEPDDPNERMVLAL